MASKPRQTAAARHRQFLRQAAKGYDELLAAQGGVCGLCERPIRDDERFHIDHDHGRRPLVVRSLLCAWCNMHLRAWMRPDWLRLAATYLERTAA